MFFSLGFRTLLIWKAGLQAKMVLVAANPNVEASLITLKTLNYLRGDYWLTYSRAPYRQLHWTVNYLSEIVVPWQSQKMQKKILDQL